MVPSMSSSRSQALEISSHTFILSAFSLEKDDEAVVVLAALDEDVDRVAGLDVDCSAGVGELAASEITPSLLPPMSTTTLSRFTCTTKPLTISPSPPIWPFGVAACVASNMAAKPDRSALVFWLVV